MEEIFKRWLRDTKNLSDNTIRNYTNRLKNKIPEKLIEIDFKKENISLYDLSIEELKNINELFEKNIYDFQEWNRTPTIGGEAWSALKYLIEFLQIQSNDLIQTDLFIGKNMPKSTQKQALNQILFGSPGTGKTFNTINRAIEIIDSDFTLWGLF